MPSTLFAQIRIWSEIGSKPAIGFTISGSPKMKGSLRPVIGVGFTNRLTSIDDEKFSLYLIGGPQIGRVEILGRVGFTTANDDVATHSVANLGIDVGVRILSHTVLYAGYNRFSHLIFGFKFISAEWKACISLKTCMELINGMRTATRYCHLEEKCTGCFKKEMTMLYICLILRQIKTNGDKERQG